MNGTGTLAKSWVVRIIIVNIAVFLIQMIAGFYLINHNGMMTPLKLVMTSYLGLTPMIVVEKLFIWQFFSYMFLHGGLFHLFLNMYALLIFGIPTEQAWGSKKFLLFYFFTGIGAGITIFSINMFLGGPGYIIPTIGASGAVFGLLLAFGMLFPDAEILLFFFIPMRAKFLVILYGGIELYSLFSSGGQSPISHSGHLGGLIFGLIYFFIIKKRGIKFKSKMLKAKLQKRPNKRDRGSFTDSKGAGVSLPTILKKVKSAGFRSLTDDEFQHVKYMEIMTSDNDEICVEDDFNIDDDYCKKCKNVEACILREIKKYI